ncbi:MAG: sugar transporter [Sediminibacterium sp.]|nr:sugar transporter [Sediminibacterium sp.]
MYKLLIALACCFCSSVALAQIENPVHWSFSAKKINATTYDIVLTASIDKPWHLYSQFTGKGGPIPTSIVIKPNPLLQVSTAKASEVGKAEKTLDANFGNPPIPVVYFSNEVQFVKRVTVKANVKTNVAGTIEYMVCNDSKCLPPTKQAFDIKLP